MGHDIQDVFNRIKEKKKELKDLRAVCKDVIDSSEACKEVNEKLKVLREKRKQIMAVVQEQCSGELTKIEDLKIDIESDEDMLTDMAMTKYIKGESIELQDQYDNNYEPVFTVKFKKV